MKKISKMTATLLCILLLVILLPACTSNTTDNSVNNKEDIKEETTTDISDNSEEESQNDSSVIQNDEKTDDSKVDNQTVEEESNVNSVAKTEANTVTNDNTNSASLKSPKDKPSSKDDVSTNSNKTKPTKKDEANQSSSDINTNQESDKENTQEETTTNNEVEINIQDSYVEFGSYPQREVVQAASDSGVYGKTWATENDYIVDTNLYNTLNTLSEDKWDVNGDTNIDGNKYRRLCANDVTYSTSNDANYYNWSDTDTYHYFKYEPIKWKVLENNGEEVFLMSEVALDDQMYNTKITNLTWQTSTIRSWLNGYDASNNDYGTDYSNNNFIDTAFSDNEQSKIKTTTISNQDNIKSGTEGGDDTSDKIYLLSEDETYGDNATKYGFVSNYDTHDAARQAASSTYAKAMGAYADLESDSLGNCFWWLRSPGSYTGLYVLVRCNGSVYRGGQHANSKTRAVRPVLWITL